MSRDAARPTGHVRRLTGTSAFSNALDSASACAAATDKWDADEDEALSSPSERQTSGTASLVKASATEPSARCACACDATVSCGRSAQASCVAESGSESFSRNDSSKKGANLP